jgi:hypothetical protein
MDHCFDKEEEFKEMLENLDIENIVLKKGTLTKKGEAPELEAHFNLEIEKLLSEDEDESLITIDLNKHRNSEDIQPD